MWKKSHDFITNLNRSVVIKCHDAEFSKENHADYHEWH